MKKQIGNIEIEVYEATNCGEAFVVFLSVRTVKAINLLPDDARDLIHGLEWALRQGATVNGPAGNSP